MQQATCAEIHCSPVKKIQRKLMSSDSNPIYRNL
jgi:hypothetical protein